MRPASATGRLITSHTRFSLAQKCLAAKSVSNQPKIIQFLSTRISIHGLRGSLQIAIIGQFYGVIGAVGRDQSLCWRLRLLFLTRSRSSIFYGGSKLLVLTFEICELDHSRRVGFSRVLAFVIWVHC